MKKIFRIALIIILTAISIAAMGIHLFSKPHQGIGNETPALSINSSLLVADFEGDENIANSKYLGKIIEVTGKITEKDSVSIILKATDLAGVNCAMDKNYKIDHLKEGQQVKIKGICTGILMDVVLVDCVIEN